MRQEDILNSLKYFNRKLEEDKMLSSLRSFNNELKFNPNHEPAGRETGGQFTSNNLTEGEEFEARRKELGIPPAWTNVKINKDTEADLLATGKDSKGRTQYIYSENATMKAAAVKFARNKELIEKEGYITKQNLENIKSADASIAEPARVMSLIHSTGIRPGSLKETGAKVQAFGATTLEGRHVIESVDGVRLQFVGKKGVSLDIPVNDKDVAKMLIERKKIAGDTGRLFNTTDDELRKYSKKLDGGGFKPKDFRTLKGTKTALEEVKKLKRAKTLSEYKKSVMGVAKKVSTVLGNTPSIALKSYINPFVFLPLKPI